jgi:threonine/homoserine/homoserine lactone efflux protein
LTSILGIDNLGVFIGAGILLNIYPGPDTLYIIGRSLSQGRGAGVCAALGISSGAVVHTLLGAFGLSAILATSASAFTILKYLGCAYLVFQGVQLIRGGQRKRGNIAAGQQRVGLNRIYRQGALTNILNPKVALFFLAFLPQFISFSSPNKPLSFIVLGGIFVTTGTIWCMFVALCASSLNQRLHASETVSGRLRTINGSLFILLGLKLATEKLH